MISNIDPSAELFLADLNRLQASTARAQRQISSGVKIQQPSDAPDQISRLLQLEAGLAKNAQISTNLGNVKAQTDFAEQSVGQAAQLLEQAVVLAAEGSGTTQTAAGRTAIAAQVQGIQEDLVALSRTQVAGRFVFSGDADQSAAYQLDLTSANGVQRLSTAGATRQIETPGGALFSPDRTAQTIFDHRNADDTYATDNAFAALNALRTSLLASDSAGLSTALTSLRAADDYVNGQQAFYGVIQNRVSDAVTAAGAKDTALQSEISQIRDTDITEAALALSSGSTAQNAALAASLTFALEAHFRDCDGRILFAFNDGTGETSQVKTLPLF